MAWHGGAVRVVLFSALALAGTDTRAATGVVYNVQGRIFYEDQLREAYQTVMPIYGIDLDSRQCKTLGSMGGQILDGTAVQTVGNRLWIQASDGRRVAIQGHRSGLPVAGESIHCAVIRPKSATLSIRDRFRRKSSAPQYTDVTMTYSDFVQFLRRGQHFPEVPQLGTRAGRKGMFSTRRANVNKVQDILADRSTNSASYSSSVP